MTTRADASGGRETARTGPATTRKPAAPRRESEQRVVILSGLSGAGKTAATKLFEDLGYTCMDNLPGELLPDLAELMSTDRQRFDKVAVVLDVRAGNAPLALAAMRGALEGRDIKPRVIFLEARDDVAARPKCEGSGSADRGAGRRVSGNSRPSRRSVIQIPRASRLSNSAARSSSTAPATASSKSIQAPGRLYGRPILSRADHRASLVRHGVPSSCAVAPCERAQS